MYLIAQEGQSQGEQHQMLQHAVATVCMNRLQSDEKIEIHKVSNIRLVAACCGDSLHEQAAIRRTSAEDEPNQWTTMATVPARSLAHAHSTTANPVLGLPERLPGVLLHRTKCIYHECESPRVMASTATVTLCGRGKRVAMSVYCFLPAVTFPLLVPVTTSDLALYSPSSTLVLTQLF
ncbi:hypothetical protein J6590_051980 [Homalodisca vitripennis]|nr:hypothetical protein J6590_051980 [Homalodisca vitripennis]